jgi:hypothetical protein
MWSNIAFQSFFQVALLCYLLIAGADDFSTVAGSTEHYTIIFTTFVFCQVFNELNARSIGHEFNIFAGLHKNLIFVFIEIFTCVTQYVLVTHAGDFIKVVPLSNDQWMKCILLASLTLPIGGIMRFSPIRESQHDFAAVPALNGAAKKNKTISKQQSNNGMNLETSTESAFKFSALVWFIIATCIPVMVWSVFGDTWVIRFGPIVNMYLQK